MAQLHFPINLSRQIMCPDAVIEASNVAELLRQYFSQHPKVKSYILDDQGTVRKHVVILIDGINMRDREYLTDKLKAHSEVHVFQALSGG